MVVVTYLCRRGARYHYRRRLHSPIRLSQPITVPLGTADPAEARRLVARLSVRWDVMTATMGETVKRGYLTASEAAAVFRRGLDDELGLVTAARFDAAGTDDGGRTARVLEAVYRTAARLAPDAESVSAELLEEMTPGFVEPDRRAVVLMLRALAPHRAAGDDAKLALAVAGAPINGATVRDARVQLLLARAEAQVRAALIDEPHFGGSGDPVVQLLDDDAVRAFRTMPQLAPTPQPASVTPHDLPFLTADTRRVSEVIEETIKAIQVSRDWNKDVAQRRRVIQAFAWITGDKRLCDYRPADTLVFAQAMLNIPNEFRWGSLTEGAMSRPYADVLTEIENIEGGTQRGDRTYNRDLTTLSRFSRELAKTAWRPRFGKDLILDFTEHAASVTDDPGDPDRMPWTEQQLRCAFSSPLFTGGGACSRRFKTDRDIAVWHDAAYWVPLLLAYAFTSREEACGLESGDFVFDAETPFVVIRANMTRSKDGVKPAGLKRPARGRAIPLHPELLRLGLQGYVEAMAAAGHAMIFPELYQPGMINTGGKRFYASAGRYLLDHVDAIEPLLRTSKGKRADLHSMRTTGASVLEDSEAKQIHVDDIMGHARKGTGPRKYSRAWLAKGGAAILARRLELMMAATPVVTGDLRRQPLNLLPLTERARTGSSIRCASRPKAKP